MYFNWCISNIEIKNIDIVKLIYWLCFYHLLFIVIIFLPFSLFLPSLVLIEHFVQLYFFSSQHIYICIYFQWLPLNLHYILTANSNLLSNNTVPFLMYKYLLTEYSQFSSSIPCKLCVIHFIHVNYILITLLLLLFQINCYVLGQSRINKWSYIKVKSSCTAKETTNKMKREPTVCENTFTNDTLDKALISKLYK